MFVYFLPGLRSLDERDIQRWGVAHAFDRHRRPEVREVTRGPDGGPGVVVGPMGGRIGFYPESQAWRKMPHAPAWCGWATDGKCVPEELARREKIPGREVILGDDQAWTCPVARAWTMTGSGPRWSRALPGQSTLDDQGKWTDGEVLKPYQRLWDFALAFWDVYRGGLDAADSRVTIDYQGEHEACVEALAANYHVGPVEVSALGLLNQQSVSEILLTLIDHHRLMELLADHGQKKTTDPTT